MSTDADQRPARVTSIDAARGLVMFTMIFVNDIAGVSHKVVPDWLRHFKGRSGMTFVDLVFPAFLFIVGMSIPSALGGRLRAGEPVWKTLLHVVARTLSLLLIGILMVNDESPGPTCPDSRPTVGRAHVSLRHFRLLLHFTAGPDGAVSRNQKALAMDLAGASPGRVGRVAGARLHVPGRQGPAHHQSVALRHPHFLVRDSRTDRLGLPGGFDGLSGVSRQRGRAAGLHGVAAGPLPGGQDGRLRWFWLSRYVGIGEMLGAHPSITVGGLLLASILPPSGKT
jgi:hypothetical protein